MIEIMERRAHTSIECRLYNKQLSLVWEYSSQEVAITSRFPLPLSGYRVNLLRRGRLSVSLRSRSDFQSEADRRGR